MVGLHKRTNNFGGVETLVFAGGGCRLPRRRIGDYGRILWSVDEGTIVASADLGFDIALMFFVVFELDVDLLTVGFATKAILSFHLLFH